MERGFDGIVTVVMRWMWIGLIKLKKDMGDILEAMNEREKGNFYELDEVFK